MAFFQEGETLSWDELAQHVSRLKRHALRQFIAHYNVHVFSEGHDLKYGDEIECLAVDFSGDVPKLWCGAEGIIDRVDSGQIPYSAGTLAKEYAKWMFETIPAEPFSSSVTSLVQPERKMAERRAALNAILPPGVKILTMPSFPLLGVGDFTSPPLAPGGDVTLSEYFSDEIINSHPRFATLTRNIRVRRGQRVSILIPIFRDTNTEGGISILPPQVAQAVKEGTLPERLRTAASSLEVRHQLVNSSLLDDRASSAGKAVASLPPSSTVVPTLGQTGVTCIKAGAQVCGCSSLAFTPSATVSLSWPNCVCKCNSACESSPSCQCSEETEDRAAELSPVVPGTPMIPGFGHLRLSDPAPAADVELLKICDENSELAEQVHTFSDSAADIKDLRHFGYVHSDAMAAGMGNCGLQATFQCKNVAQARQVYDLMIPLTGPLSALAANTPVFRGLLTDVDARYGIIADSVDDREPASLIRGVDDIQLTSRGRLAQSRYGLSSLYISLTSDNLPTYNDILVPAHAPTLRSAVKLGMDHLMSAHIAHVFSRSPLVVYDSEIASSKSRRGSIGDDGLISTHSLEEGHPVPTLFEGMQSANWQTVRFKPPPPSDTNGIGWRVEFRPLDVQLTDFENGAFTALVNLFVRVSLVFALNFYVPMSSVHDGFRRSLRRGALASEKFLWRKNVFSSSQCDCPSEVYETAEQSKTLGVVRKWIREVLPPAEEGFEMLSVAEILNGKDGYPGLIPLIRRYLSLCLSGCTCGDQCKRVCRVLKVSSAPVHVRQALQEAEPGLETHKLNINDAAHIGHYLELLERRAAGELETGAQWQRRHLLAHPDYAKDSVVTGSMTKDLLERVLALEKDPSDLVGHF